MQEISSKYKRIAAENAPPQEKWARAKNIRPQEPAVVPSVARTAESPQQHKNQNRNKQRHGGDPDEQKDDGAVPVSALTTRRNTGTDTRFPFLKGAGAIPYRFKNRRLKLLVTIKARDGDVNEEVIDCFGGKVDEADADSASTAGRELAEESSCEPYMYIHDVAPAENDAEYRSIFRKAQAYFESLIRKSPNLIVDRKRKDSWGVYFFEMPRVPTDIFPYREDERTKEGAGDRYEARWVDIWDLLDTDRLSGRMRCVDIRDALAEIYRLDAEQHGDAAGSSSS
jgi:hypothetical protein